MPNSCKLHQKDCCLLECSPTGTLKLLVNSANVVTKFL